jgi:hypothetical protein
LCREMGVAEEEEGRSRIERTSAELLMSAKGKAGRLPVAERASITKYGS